MSSIYYSEHLVCHFLGRKLESMQGHFTEKNNATSAKATSSGVKQLSLSGAEQKW